MVLPSQDTWCLVILCLRLHVPISLQTLTRLSLIYRKNFESSLNITFHWHIAETTLIVHLRFGRIKRHKLRYPYVQSIDTIHPCSLWFVVVVDIVLPMNAMTIYFTHVEVALRICLTTNSNISNFRVGRNPSITDHSSSDYCFVV